MPAFTLSLTLALSLASILTSAALLPRSLVCANDGTTRAGDLFLRDSPSPPPPVLQRRGDNSLPCVICVPNTRTFVIIRSFEAISGTMGNMIYDMLLTAVAQAGVSMLTLGNGPVRNGCVNMVSNGVRWISINQNNHQQTLSVVAAAIKGVLSFMTASGEYGWVTFDIVDGMNQVGSGRLMREWEGPDVPIRALCGGWG